MIKPSEFTPRTSELMKQMFEDNFTEEEVAVVTGGPEVGADFSSLPFDHLIIYRSNFNRKACYEGSLRKSCSCNT